MQGKCICLWVWSIVMSTFTCFLSEGGEGLCVKLTVSGPSPACVVNLWDATSLPLQQKNSSVPQLKMDQQLIFQWLVFWGIQLSCVWQLLLVFCSCKETPNNSFSLFCWCFLLSSNTWLLVHHRSQRPNAQHDSQLLAAPCALSKRVGDCTENQKPQTALCVFSFVAWHSWPHSHKVPALLSGDDAWSEGKNLQSFGGCLHQQHVAWSRIPESQKGGGQKGFLEVT